MPKLWSGKLGIALLALSASIGGVELARGADKDTAKTESQLKEVRRQIDRIREQVTRDALRRDQIAAELQAAEQTVGSVRNALARLQAERAERAARRDELAVKRQTQERALAAERESLAAQIRAASLIGREEPLKLLLNQNDPALVGRMFDYYRYFGRARAEQIASIEARVAALDEIDAAVAAEDARLADLERERRVELARLQSSRDQRGKVLASLENASRSRERQLARLQRQQAGLEKLLQERNGTHGQVSDR
jgi:septal ring factor EnvC (AmiA/AmiB activator)